MTPVAAKKNRGFDPHNFLATIGEGRNLLTVPKGQSIYKGIRRTLSSMSKTVKCGSPSSPKPARKRPSAY